MEALRVTEWVRKIQMERVTRLLNLENEQQRILPQMKYEMELLLRANEEVTRLSRLASDTTEPPLSQQTEGLDQAIEKLNDLDSIDRNLLRDACETLSHTRPQAVDKRFAGTRDSGESENPT